MTTTSRPPEHPRVATIRAQREAAERRAAQLRAQERDLASRLLAQQRERDRRDDTRRKILVGSMMLHMMAHAPELRMQLLAQLDSFLNRDVDRLLFRLPPHTKAAGIEG